MIAFLTPPTTAVRLSPTPDGWGSLTSLDWAPPLECWATLSGQHVRLDTTALAPPMLATEGQHVLVWGDDKSCSMLVVETGAESFALDWTPIPSSSTGWVWVLALLLAMPWNPRRR